MFSFKFADRIFRIWRHQATMIMDCGTNNDGNSNATERNIGKMGYPLTHHGPVPHICVAIFSAYFRSAPDMWRWFQCSFLQCPIHGVWQTARSSPVPQIVVARPHLLSHQRPIYVARHGPLSLHVLCGKYWMLSPIYWLFFPITVFHKV